MNDHDPYARTIMTRTNLRSVSGSLPFLVVLEETPRIAHPSPGAVPNEDKHTSNDLSIVAVTNKGQII